MNDPILIIAVIALILWPLLLLTAVLFYRKRRSYKWLVFYGIAMFIAIGGAAYFSYNFLQKYVKEMVANGNLPLPEEPYNPTAYTFYIEKLQNLEAEKYIGKVPADFYVFYGYGNWHRYPLVYPYSVNYTDSLNYAILHDESFVAHITYRNFGPVHPAIPPFSKIAFDEKMLLAKIVDPEENKNYVIFTFENQQILFVSTEKNLFHEAVKLGFNSEKQLIPIKAYAGFFKRDVK